MPPTTLADTITVADLDRDPNLHLDPAHDVTLHGWEFRGVTQLHLRWDA